MTAIDMAARALVAARGGADDYDGLAPARQAVLKGEVRAILQAIRDPSERMTGAGAEIIRNVHQGESDEAFRSDAANTWRFMIDAVLDE